MPILSRPGAQINYEVWGTEGSSWVTLVNGHTRPLNDFRLMGKKLVESGFRVVALDNRGAGATTVAAGFTLAEMCGDVRALWDELGVAETNLLGISMGGFISEQLTLDAPGKVRKLALVSTASRHETIQGDDLPWSSDITATAAKLARYFTVGFAERNAVLVRSMAKQIAAQVETGKFVDNSRMQREALKGFDLSQRLFEINAPTLVVHGTEDQIIPVSEGELLASSIPNARLKLIEKSGHLLLAEAPGVLYQAVIEFFKD